MVSIPLYTLSVGVPRKTIFNKPEGIVTISEEGSGQESFGNSGLVVAAVNEYQVTENWIGFEIVNIRYYDRGLLYAFLFDSMIIIAFRLTQHNR